MITHNNHNIYFIKSVPNVSELIHGDLTNNIMKLIYRITDEPQKSSTLILNHPGLNMVLLILPKTKK